MEQLFDGIPLGEINTSMTINATAPFLLALYLVVAEKHGVPWTELRGTTQNDLMKEFVARGTSIFQPGNFLPPLDRADQLRGRARAELESDQLLRLPLHGKRRRTGRRDRLRIRQRAADSRRAAPELERRGLRADRPAHFVLHQQRDRAGAGDLQGSRVLQTVARALRDEYGIDDVAFRAGCQVRSLTLTEQQPEVNIIRIAYEALPVVLSADARVNALQLPGFREAMALPDQAEQTDRPAHAAGADARDRHRATTAISSRAAR